MVSRGNPWYRCVGQKTTMVKIVCFALSVNPRLCSRRGLQNENRRLCFRRRTTLPRVAFDDDDQFMLLLSGWDDHSEITPTKQSLWDFCTDPSAHASLLRAKTKHSSGIISITQRPCVAPERLGRNKRGPDAFIEILCNHVLHLYYYHWEISISCWRRIRHRLCVYSLICENNPLVDRILDSFFEKDKNVLSSSHLSILIAASVDPPFEKILEEERQKFLAPTSTRYDTTTLRTPVKSGRGFWGLNTELIFLKLHPGRHKNDRDIGERS